VIIERRGVMMMMIQILRDVVAVTISRCFVVVERQHSIVIEMYD
jgi:hypothetical protein